MINNLPPPKRKTHKKKTPVSSKKSSQNASSTNLDKIYNISPTCNTLKEWRFPQTNQPKFRGWKSLNVIITSCVSIPTFKQWIWQLLAKAHIVGSCRG